MVRHGNQDTPARRFPQGWEEHKGEANEINAATPYDLEGKNLTA